jgi:hypothetical protein
MGNSNRVHLIAIAALCSVLVTGAFPAIQKNSAHAQTSAQTTSGSAYSVTTVSVDVTAGTASEAREQALNEGQARALVLMMRRLTRERDWAQLPSIPPQDAERYVLDFEIVDERTSNVRYLADINVRFRPDAVHDLLRSSGIQFASTQSLPVVILPILRQGSTTLLWEESNLWRTGWSGLPGTDGIVPLMVPFGDISDIQEIDAAAVARRDPAGLRRIAENHGASDSLIATADLDTEGRFVDINLDRVGMVNQAPIAFRVNTNAAQDRAALLREAAQLAAARIQSDWVNANMPQLGAEQMLMVEVRFDGLNGWVTVKDRLTRVPTVARNQVRMVSRQAALIELAFAGSFDQLSNAMSQAGLLLTYSFPQNAGRFRTRQPVPQSLPILQLATNR